MMGKGGRLNNVTFQTKEIDFFLRKLDEIGGDLKKAVNEAFEVAGRSFAQATEEALAPPELPAGGKYSKGTTEKSIVQNPVVRWEGNVGWIPIGFDFNLPGAGGFLIAGTPRMSPDRLLRSVYRGSKTINQIRKEVSDIIMNHIDEKFTG